MLGLYLDLNPIFPSPVLFFSLAFLPLPLPPFPPLVILGSFEHSVTPAGWVMPTALQSLAELMPGAGADRVVLVASAPGPEVGCCSWREAIRESCRMSKPGAWRGAMLQLPQPLPSPGVGRACAQAEGGEGWRHVGLNLIGPKAEQCPRLALSPQAGTGWGCPRRAGQDGGVVAEQFVPGVVSSQVCNAFGLSGRGQAMGPGALPRLCNTQL